MWVAELAEGMTDTKGDRNVHKFKCSQTLFWDPEQKYSLQFANISYL